MIRRSARNDPTAGSVSGKKLSDIIEQTKKNEELDNRVYRHPQEVLRETRQRQAQEAARTAQETFKQPWEGVDSQEAYKRGYEAGLRDEKLSWLKA